MLIKKAENIYSLLRNKQILAILDGDTDFGEIEVDGNSTVKNALPYLSGPDICSISNNFGLAITYGWSGGALSRWSYLDNLIEYCIKKDKMSNLLSFLFSKEQFIDRLRGCSPTEIDKLHKKIVSTAIEKINGLLYFGGNELYIVNSQFLMRQIGTSISVSAPAVRVVNSEYIKNLSERALKDVADESYDSAITKSRTLLEEVFCYVIEKNNEIPSDSGDIGKLYNQVKTLYNMHQDKNTDKRINMLLSGFEKIITAITQMRNEGSDSHGIGSKRINIKEHHARLFVNTATVMADFIIEVAENNLQ